MNILDLNDPLNFKISCCFIDQNQNFLLSCGILDPIGVIHKERQHLLGGEGMMSAIFQKYPLFESCFYKVKAT